MGFIAVKSYLTCITSLLYSILYQVNQHQQFSIIMTVTPLHKIAREKGSQREGRYLTFPESKLEETDKQKLLYIAKGSCFIFI